MPFPVKVCVLCSEEFELKPDKPGFANRCPACSLQDEPQTAERPPAELDDRRSASERNEARKQAMRNLLYRRDGD